MREIITLQLGNLSNYVGTHFWNTQESYFTFGEDEYASPVDHRIHWRPGIGADGGDTFLPRTLIYDLKGGFGSLRRINALYDTGNQNVSHDVWLGPSADIALPAVEQSAYLTALDEGAQPAKLQASDVRYWSDFSRSYFHPKSLVQLYDYELNSSIRPFDSHDMGKELFQALDKDHDFVDRDWRPFAEECDCLQGFQVFMTIDDAWGGFGSQYLEAIRDEYPKTCIWTWGLQTSLIDVSRTKRQKMAANSAQALAQTYAHSSMVVPLSAPPAKLRPNSNVDPCLPWHTSALMSSLIETATIPTRLSARCGSSPVSLDGLVEQLNNTGDRRLAKAHMKVRNDEQLEQLDFSQTAAGEAHHRKLKTARDFSHLHVSRGGGWHAQDTDIHPSDDIPRRWTSDSTTNCQYSTALAFPMLDSFPRVFGEGTTNMQYDLLATLSTGTDIGAQVKNLRVGLSYSLPLQEREDLAAELANIEDAYHDGWRSDSDPDDDEL